jgi:hypothetical protein
MVTEACLAGIGFPDTYPQKFPSFFLVEKLLDWISTWQEISILETKVSLKSCVVGENRLYLYSMGEMPHCMSGAATTTAVVVV